jgi:molybdopterin-containing oxidoreductase family iron-sulfur binding subunit
MASNKKYWKSVEDLQESSIVETLRQNEFVEEIPTSEFIGDKESLEASSTSRRDFLKYVGFSTAAAALAACEGPVHKSIPYVVQPEQMRPGVADFYATTIANGFDFASVLVKTREGRPIKIENNTEATSNCHANARVHASVLDLYDSARVKTPKGGGSTISWSKLDSDITKELNAATAADKQVVLMTQTFASPTTTKLIEEFKAKFPTTRHVVYDAVSESAALDAFQSAYGYRALAHYDFTKATTILGVGADFIGDWQGGGYDSEYAQGRIPKNGKMSRHIQFEANMTLTGANADTRVMMKPSEQKRALAKLYSVLVGGPAVTLEKKLDAAVTAAAKELDRAGSNAVVVTGIQDKDAQTVVLAINEQLKSKAFNTSTPRMIRQGSNEQVTTLIDDMNNGKVAVLVMSGINPSYTLPNANAFNAGLKKTTAVSFSLKEDETATQCNYVAAAPHYLESWGDAEMTRGSVSLMQPTINPLFDTRQFQDSLLRWVGNTDSYYDYLKNHWSQAVSWNKALHDGVFQVPIASAVSSVDASEQDELAGVQTTGDVTKAARNLANVKADAGFELTLYTKIGMGDGQQVNNPWLQEFPDPITRASWDNYMTISKADAKEQGIENWNVANGALNGSYATIALKGGTPIKVPVIIQPGQAPGTVGLSLGYGRKMGGKAEMLTGVDAYPLYKDFNTVQSVTLGEAAGEHEFACIQLHNTLMGRGDIVKETTLDVFNTQDAKDWNVMPMVSKDHEMIPATSPDADLWDSFDRSIGHHFKLSIDLNSCTGCGACVIACHAENNVPVVGKSEVRRSRDMHWLRIDRYYSSQETFAGDDKMKNDFTGLSESLGGFSDMEDPSANPQVVFQPVMCQHCNHAPCETVCPVAATSHGRQGQNHMAYNRCVGTRYCANNCPYKVRRFNWFLYNGNEEFDYHMNDDLGRMVLNPDVVVRSRGVMEKCSFCIQSTQAIILKAKREGRPVAKDEFNDSCACSAACGSGAMRFGDVNEDGSEISKLVKDDRAYHLLEHVGTEPNVVYQVKVRNTKEA